MRIKLNELKEIIREIINEELIDSNNNLKDLSQEKINEIFKGYIECALWTDEERLNDEYYEEFVQLKDEFKNKMFNSFVSDDIDVDSKIDAYNDIKTFIKNAGDEAVNEAIEENGLFQLGMDIWLTRNGHGSGFFDHNYDNEDILEQTAKELGSSDIYIGDDAKLYFS